MKSFSFLARSSRRNSVRAKLSFVCSLIKSKCDRQYELSFIWQQTDFKAEDSGLSITAENFHEGGLQAQLLNDALDSEV